MIVMNDFQKEYALIKEEIDAAIKTCLESGWYILGKQVEAFEAAFATYIGTTYCLGVANGMEALQIALMALNIGEGDEVITTAHSAVATALAISNVGATPVFVDIDDYYHVDIAEIEKKITTKTKAIIPVHLFGQMVDIEALQALADKHGLKIIEDACQAHGAALNGKKAGSFGEIGCFSFYPTKNLGGYGDGGAIVTNSKELYETCKMLRNYGQTNRYEHVIKGLNSRLDELQAAILKVKLRHLDNFLAKRNAVAQQYLDKLAGVDQVTVPQIRPNTYHAFHLFVIRAERRDELMAYLKEKGIQSLIHYPKPIHKQPCYGEMHEVSLPKTEEAAAVMVSLPIHPLMTEAEVETITSAIKEFYSK